MAFAGNSNLEAATTSFITAVNAFSADKPQPTYEKFTTTFPVDGEFFDVLVMDGEPQFRQWIGARRYHNYRVYRRQEQIVPWEKTIKIDEISILTDKTGLVQETINAHAASVRYAYDQIVIDALLANPTCYDAATLMSNSHVNTGTGTSDNLETGALTHALMNTAFVAMGEMTNENNEPLFIRPTHLLVGPQQARLGME